MINGTQTFSFDVCCNEANICKIDCQSNDACSNLNLHCFGICLVQCDPGLVDGNTTTSIPIIQCPNATYDLSSKRINDINENGGDHDDSNIEELYSRDEDSLKKDNCKMAILQVLLV